MLKFYCFPTWTTCRKAKAWLSEKDAGYNYRDIVKEPPSIEELFELARLGGIKVSGLLNPKSKNYKDLGISAQNLSEQEIAELLSANPKMMYRPLLTNGKKLVVGFNPEQIEEIL